MHIHRCVNKSSWEEAEQSFPAFTDEKRLHTFVGLPTKGGVPQPLKDYCEAAKKSTNMSDAEQTVQTITKDGSMAIFVPGSFKSVSGDGLIAKIPTYKGVKLIIACIDDVSVRMFMYICVCMFVCVYVHACVHACMSACVWACVCACVCVCVKQHEALSHSELQT